MRFRAVLGKICCAGLLLAAAPVGAATPEDLYLDAYRWIQEGDQLLSVGNSEQAQRRYDEAQVNLKKLQSAYPAFNPRAVEYRLEYVQKQIGSTGRRKDPAPAAPVAPRRPGPADSARVWQERVNQLEAENTLLQGKLQEALAPRPAAVDPQELARAEARVRELEKEKELLRANLAKAEAQQPQAADGALLEQARRELTETKQRLTDAVASIASLSQSKLALETANQKLQQDLAGAKAEDPEKARLRTLSSAQQTQIEQLRTELDAARKRAETLAAAPKPEALKPEANEKSRVKDLENERDRLQKQLAETQRDLSNARSRTPTGQADALTAQLSNLRARLEVFEARKVPYTAEELALLAKAAPVLAAAPDPKAGKRSVRELPAGAGPLVAEAERAFAARRYGDAENLYQRVLRMDEDNPLTLANLASIQLELSKFPEAEANLNKALQGSPDDAYATSLLGMARFMQAKYPEALEFLSRAAQLDPKDPKTQNQLGITLGQMGHREASETALRKAIQLAPNYAEAHYNLAVVYATQKPPFLELAKFHYAKALGLGHAPVPDLEKQLGPAK